MVVTGTGRGIRRETARFSKDPTFLNEIAQSTAKRTALIDALLGALEAV
jgi:hypothetical protein